MDQSLAKPSADRLGHAKLFNLRSKMANCHVEIERDLQFAKAVHKMPCKILQFCFECLSPGARKPCLECCEYNVTKAEHHFSLFRFQEREQHHHEIRCKA